MGAAALVRRAEEHVELEPRLGDRARVEAAELGDAPAGVEEAGVEEVGARAARLEREFAKAEDLAVDAEMEKLVLPRRLGGGHSNARGLG